MCFEYYLFYVYKHEFRKQPFGGFRNQWHMLISVHLKRK